MRTLVLVLTVGGALALALAPALALPSGMDARVDIVGDSAPTLNDPTGTLRFVNMTAGETYVFEVNASAPYTTYEFVVDGALNVERAKQLVPHLALDANESACVAKPGACDYTIFEPFPHERVWEVDGSARVYHANGTPDAVVLRLGIPGPANATLALQRDVTPPSFTLLAPTDVTHGSFIQETRTDELALGDLQIRRLGATEWIRNPTPTFHVRQIFPVQGLDAATTYELRILFEDWAQNEAASETLRITTPSAPVLAAPTIEILAPAANATLPPGSDVTLRARVTSAGSPISSDGVRVFFDKREVTDRVTRAGDDVQYFAGILGPGAHSASIEVVTEEGGKASARLSFAVEEARTPLPALSWFLLAAAVALAVRAKR